MVSNLSTVNITFDKWFTKMFKWKSSDSEKSRKDFTKIFFLSKSIVNTKRSKVLKQLTLVKQFKKQWKGLWNLVRERVLRDTGALPEEEGDVIRENKTMCEQNFLSSWWREDGKEKEEIIMEAGKETMEERGKKRRRGDRRERNGKC